MEYRDFKTPQGQHSVWYGCGGMYDVTRKNGEIGIGGKTLRYGGLGTSSKLPHLSVIRHVMIVLFSFATKKLRNYVRGLR